jgi:hypothetical protein
MAVRRPCSGPKTAAAAISSASRATARSRLCARKPPPRCAFAICWADKLRACVSFPYKAKTWKRPRRIIARLEASMQPTPDGHLRQEIDIRYAVTSLDGDPDHLFETVYCARGQAENLIKLHKAQLASDRTSCPSATANQVRLVLHTAAYWIMHALRACIPATNPMARCEFTTLRLRLIKIGAASSSTPPASACICRRVARSGICSPASPAASCRRPPSPGGMPPPEPAFANPNASPPRVPVPPAPHRPTSRGPTDA